MESAVKQRIKEVLSYFNTTQNKLAKGDVAFQKRLSSQLNGKTALSYQTINSILTEFPDVSAEWLLRGSGEMLIADNINVYNIKGTDNSVNVGGDSQGNISTNDGNLIAKLLEQNQQLIAILARRNG